MKVLERKLWRELLHARLQLVAILAIAAMGVACFVTMATAHRNLETSRIAYYNQCRMADFWVNLKKAPLADVADLQNIPGVLAIQPRISLEVRVDLEGVKRPLSGRLISIPPDRTGLINNIVMMRGSTFSGDGREQTIINDAFARARHINTGDHISIIVNNHIQDLLVVGTALSSEFVYQVAPGSIVPDNINYGVFYLSRPYAEEITDFQGACNELVGLIRHDDQSRTQEILDKIERRLEPFGVFTTTTLNEQPSNRFLIDEIRQLRNASIMMPIIFLSVSALVLNILLTRLVEQQRTIVGTLKALGYSDGRIFGHYLGYGLVVGVIGGIIGIGIGLLLATGMTIMYRHFFSFPRLDNHRYPDILLLGIVISIAFALLGAIRGVRSVVRLSPAQAMRPKAPPIGHRVLIERISMIWTRLDYQWRMIVRDMARMKLRTAAGLFAAAMGAMLTVIALGFWDSIEYMISFQFDKLLLADYELQFKDEHSFASYYEATRRLPGADRVEPVLNVSCTLENGNHSKRMGITGLIPGATLTIPRDRNGARVEVPSSGLVISQTLAEILDVHPGDKLTMIPIKGDRTPRTVFVRKLVNSYLGLAAYADYDYLNALVGEHAAVSGVEIRGHPDQAVTAAFYASIRERPAIQTVSDIRQEKQRLISTFLDTMRYSVGTLIAFAGIIYFGSILTTSLISLSERQSQVATLRVLGFTPREVGALFLRQSLLVNFAGSLLGLPLGYWVMRWSIGQYATEMFHFPVRIDPGTWVIVVGLGIVFTLAAYFIVQRDVSRLNWVEAMKVKE